MTAKKEDRASAMTTRKTVGGGSIFRYTDKPRKAKKAKLQSVAEAETAQPEARLSASEVARLFGA